MNATAPKPAASPRVAIISAIALVVFVTGVCIGTAPLRRRYGLTTQAEHMSAQRAARTEIAARSPRLIAGTPPDGEKVYVRETCGQVTDLFSVGSDLSSDVRSARFAERYQGRWVRWAASSNRAMPLPGGMYQVQFKCSEHSLLYDGNVVFTSGAGVENLSQDEVISFEAQLTSENSMLGVQLMNATLLP